MSSLVAPPRRKRKLDGGEGKGSRPAKAKKAVKTPPAPAAAAAVVSPTHLGNVGAPKNEIRADMTRRAVDALLKYHEAKSLASKSKALLGEDDEPVHIQLTLKRVPDKSSTSAKPTVIEIPHPLYGDNDCEMCLFMKKEDKQEVKELLMEKSKVPGMAKIITLDKLRTDFARFEQKRELLATYDLFLADDRILPMLCKALGKTFFSRKKQPVPVKVTRRGSLPEQITRARNSTLMFVSSGTCISIAVGTTSMSAKQLTANIMAVVPAAIAKVPRKWKNIQAIHVKAASTDSLPIFNKLPYSDLANDAAEADEAAKAAAEAAVAATATATSTGGKKSTANKKTKPPAAAKSTTKPAATKPTTNATKKKKRKASEGEAAAEPQGSRTKSKRIGGLRGEM